MMVIRSFFMRGLLLSITSFFSIAQVFDTGQGDHIDPRTVIAEDSFESPNSVISYVKIDNTRYLLKQKKMVSKQFVVVRDALAAWIAQPLKIAHSVIIIPAKKNFPGKKHTTIPAALLTIAPGKMIRSQPNSRYYHLSLRQRTINGIFSPDRWFTETIVHQMTWHSQLPILIALDLFICNTDRHGGNLFYDPKTDCFCAIDMDNIFRRDLPAIAKEKIKLMIARGKQFTVEEIQALTSMKETLSLLLRTYSVEDIIKKLYFFVHQAGFVADNKELIAKIPKKIARHEKIITQSRVSLYALISLLDTIIHDNT
jgi:hypothetical protein